MQLFALLAAAATALQPAPSPAVLLDQAVAPLSGARPGCAAAIIQDGRLAHSVAAGLADLESATPISLSTPFNIASMSKQFTGAVIAMMIEEGKLSEDDDIRRYLPELRDYGAVIRLRDLIQHSSGLRNHMALAAFSPGSGLPTNAEALALVFRQSAINFAPGSRHQYESPGYVLLAEIASRIDRKPFEQVLADRIFRPLGMTRTGFAVPGQARAYNAPADGSFVLNERVNTARGSSGIVTTIEDFAKWLQALSDGRFGPDFLRRMTSGGRLSDGTILSYGYGLQVDRDGGTVTISHGGQTAAYRSTFSYIPQRRTGVVMLCNYSAAPLPAAAEVTAALTPSAAVEAPVVEHPHPPEKIASLAGHYHDPATDSARTFLAAEGRLSLNNFGQAAPLAHRGDRRFALGETVYTFAPDGSSIQLSEPNQPAIRLLRLPPPESAPLADFAGSYRSADVDEPLTFRVVENRLVVSMKSREAPLQAIHPDGFAAPEADFVHLTFQRDPAGRVTGLTLTTSSGINWLRYTRQPD